MENCGRLVRASTQYVVQRSIKRDGSIHTEKLDSAAPKRVGVGRYQLPLMLFAAKAQDRHARTIISKIDRNDSLAISAASNGTLFCLLRGDDFTENSVQIAANAPLWILRLKFTQIRNYT